MLSQEDPGEVSHDIRTKSGDHDEPDHEPVSHLHQRDVVREEDDVEDVDDELTDFIVVDEDETSM